MLPGDDGEDDLVGGKDGVHAAKVVRVLAVAVYDDLEHPVSCLGLVSIVFNLA